MNRANLGHSLARETQKVLHWSLEVELSSTCRHDSRMNEEWVSPARDLDRISPCRCNQSRQKTNRVVFHDLAMGEG